MAAAARQARAVEKDIEVLGLFVETYCRRHHREAGRAAFRIEGRDLSGTRLARRVACEECRKLLAYAAARRDRCPLDPKPACRLCPVHCYAAGYRQKIREVMKFSGRHLILRGRLDLLLHFLERRPKEVHRRAAPEEEKSGPAAGGDVQ